MASRFFIPPEQIHDNKFFLTGSEARHAVLVLRKKSGDVIDLFDGKNLSYQGRIDSVAPDQIAGVLLSQQEAARSAGTGLILYQSLIKGPKWDWLVEKACEVGVTRIVPMVTARTIVKPTNPAARERWRRIALAASKQCGRSDVMDVSAPKSFNEAMPKVGENILSLIPWEKENRTTIQQACQNRPEPVVNVFIGPEGGWEPAEVDLAVLHGVIPVRLGPTLLRSETAGLVAATLVLAARGIYS